MRARMALTGMAVLLVFVLAGCGGGGAPMAVDNGGNGGTPTPPTPTPTPTTPTPTTPTPANNAPAIQSLAAGAERLWPEDGTTVTCQAADEDGDELTYTWEADAGSFSGEGASVTWSGTSEPGTYEIGCQVSDGAGGSASEAVNVTVGLATVEGTVVSVLSGEAVGSAQVTVAGCSGSTDAEGQFSIPGIGPGTHEISIQVAGAFISVETIITVEVTDPASVVTLPAIPLTVILTGPEDPPEAPPL